jgi:hypothetical protein
VDDYKKRFNKTSVLHQGYPTNDFLEWYLKACNPEELKLLKEHLNKFRKNQVEKIEKAEVLKILEQPSDNSVQGYMNKNAEILANNAELIKRNDELFKKISELQDERDKLQDERNILAEKYEFSLEFAKVLIEIFKENKIKTDKLNELQIQFTKELSSK